MLLCVSIYDIQKHYNMNNTVNLKIMSSLTHGIQKSNPMTPLSKQCGSIGSNPKIGGLKFNNKN